MSPKYLAIMSVRLVNCVTGQRGKVESATRQKLTAEAACASCVCKAVAEQTIEKEIGLGKNICFFFFPHHHRQRNMRKKKEAVFSHAITGARQTNARRDSTLETHDAPLEESYSARRKVVESGK